MAGGTKAQEAKRIDEAIRQLKENLNKHATDLKELRRQLLTSRNWSRWWVLWLPSMKSLPRSWQGTTYVNLQPIPQNELKGTENTFQWNMLIWIFHSLMVMIDEDDRLYVACIYMEARALDWFQGYETFKPKITWKGFIKDLILRFSPRRYDDPVGQLTKLRQSGTIQQYQQ